MSKHGVRPGSLRVSGTGLPGGTSVQLDGHDISAALTGVSMRTGIDDRPKAVLDVVLHDLTTDIEDPRVVVPDATRDLLVRLGWTPPADEEVADAVD